MELHKDSHLDHGLTPAQIDYVLARLSDRDAFFIETLELPADLGTVPCALVGPIMGDAPVLEHEVHYMKRGDRQWDSRVIDRADLRASRQVTVIAGPHDGRPCVLYTMYGGPLAPQEPGDPGCKDVDGARRFWAEHALIVTG